MKKLSVILFLLLISSILFSADINCEIKSTATLQNLSQEPTYSLDNAAKLDFKSKGDNYYSEISAKAIYSSNNVSTSTAMSFMINRAYTEFYKDNLSFSVGKQRLAWGLGYIFNTADVFNPINISDPKGDKEGINSTTQKVNLGDTAKIELAEVFNNSKHVDYGARTSFTLGNFEFAGNYLKLNTPASTELYIGEFRGELELGFWGSGAHSITSSASVNIYTLGVDYTIDLSGNSLYFLEETKYTDNDFNKTYYGLVRFTPSQDYNISQTALVDTNSSSQIYSTILSYTLNDFITTSLTYDRYINPNIKFTGSKNSYENDLVFIVKTNF